MFPGIQFEDRVTFREVVPDNEPRRLELGQYPVDGREPHLVSGYQQGAVDVFRADVPVRVLLEDGENLEPGQGRLEPGLLELRTFGEDRSGQISHRRFGWREGARRPRHAPKNIHLSGEAIHRKHPEPRTIQKSRLPGINPRYCPVIGHFSAL